jgi:hypothetical protein
MRASINAVITHIKKDIVGAEVGVYEGSHAAQMATSDCIKKIYLIDSIEMPKLKEIINPHMSKLELLIPCTSEEAILKFQDNSLDFVYIDADHTYENVKKDLEMWWKKVKVGGLLCGHDFSVEMLGTMKAIIEFSIKNSLQLNHVVTYDPSQKTCSQSDWWLYK